MTNPQRTAIANAAYRRAIANAAQRQLGRVYSGYYGFEVKHDHYTDFGWPQTVDFTTLYRMYTRNGIAAAAVDRTISKTWETNPVIWEKEESPEETPLEAEIRKAFAKLRLWQKMAEADKRSMVGKYAGAILRIRDSKAFDQPVDRVIGGLKALAEIVPAWEGQLSVATWDTDITSENYGKPTMYQFSESKVGNTDQPRDFMVHPDRVLIWSDDGTVNCQSALEPALNALIDMEKIMGAGGEGFWKNSRGAPVIQASEGVSIQDVADGMGVSIERLGEAVNAQIDDFNKGFDKGLLLGGMTATPMSISLPQPEQFHNITVGTVAASFEMPQKILIGNQTGERASTEDAAEWARKVNSRRVNRCIPIIQEFIDRLAKWGMLQAANWTIGWADLTEASPSDKLARAKIMADINSQFASSFGEAFTAEEVREVAGYQPLEASFIDDSNDDGSDDDKE